MVELTGMNAGLSPALPTVGGLPLADLVRGARSLPK
jgi:hypothetical protein